MNQISREMERKFKVEKRTGNTIIKNCISGEKRK